MLDIFRVAKHVAAQAGLAPAGTAEGVAAFRKSARLVEGSASQRKRLGLPEVCPSGSEELAQVLARQGKAQDETSEERER